MELLKIEETLYKAIRRPNGTILLKPVKVTEAKPEYYDYIDEIIDAVLNKEKEKKGEK